MEETFQLTPASEIAKYLDELQSRRDRYTLLKFIEETIIDTFKEFNSKDLSILFSIRKPGRLRCLIGVGSGILRDYYDAPKNLTLVFIANELELAGYIIHRGSIPTCSRYSVKLPL